VLHTFAECCSLHDSCCSACIFFPPSLLPGVFRPANNMLVVRLLTDLCVLPSRVEIFKIRQHCTFFFFPLSISYRRGVMWV
jgi:hypothetical protein